MSLLICYDRENPDVHSVKLIDFGRSYLNSEIDQKIRDEQQRTICEGLENIVKVCTGVTVVASKPKPYVDIDFAQVDKEVKEMEDEAASKDLNSFLPNCTRMQTPRRKWHNEQILFGIKRNCLSTNWVTGKLRGEALCR